MRCHLHVSCADGCLRRAGSTYLRVGRASDAAPVEVPHVVAFPRRGAAATSPRAVDAPAPFAPDAEREAACRQARRAARVRHATR
jgi:hypothetical protein